jgi:hypothetical protein
MYLRHTTIRKDGKTHTYWRLVRSVRRGRKVVQETVAHLGELDGQSRARARRLALQMNGGGEQHDLFEAAPVGEPVQVLPQRVQMERMRRFGDVWLGGGCGVRCGWTSCVTSSCRRAASRWRGVRWWRSW